jgi:hypothetical protein
MRIMRPREGNANKIDLTLRSGIEVDCELFNPPLKASEIEEIGIY